MKIFHITKGHVGQSPGKIAHVENPFTEAIPRSFAIVFMKIERATEQKLMDFLTFFLSQKKGQQKTQKGIETY